MFSAEDLPIWIYILTVGVGSAMFLHRQRQDSQNLRRQILDLESRLHARFDELERELHPEASQPRSRFKLVRSSDG